MLCGAEESELCVFKNAPLMISNSDPEERKQYYIETRKYVQCAPETAFSNSVSSNYTYTTAQPQQGPTDAQQILYCTLICGMDTKVGISSNLFYIVAGYQPTL